MDPQVQAIVNTLTKDITLPVTQAQVPSIVVAAISATSSMLTLSRANRIQLITGVVNYYITNSNISSDEQTVIMNLLPGMIDSLLNSPTIWTSIANWFKTNCKCCCCSCCTKP